MHANFRVLYPMTGGSIGGSHIALLSILRNLPQEITPIVYLDCEGDFSSLLELHNIEYKIIDNDRTIRNNFTFLNKLFYLIRNLFYWRSLLKNENIALIHLSDDPFPLTCIPYARLLNMPCIFHHHIILANSRLTRCMAYLSKYNIFTSHLLQRLSPNIVGRVINNSVDLPLIDKKKKRSPRKRIGFFANLYIQKRPFLFLECIKILNDRGMDVTGHIYGKDVEITSDELNEYAIQNGISDKLYFSDFVNNISSHMIDMDVIVAPARNEAFGRVLIEAMSLNVPVVASRDGGHMEIIEDGITGLFFEPDSVLSLVEKVEWLLKNEEDMKNFTQKPPLNPPIAVFNAT